MTLDLFYNGFFLSDADRKVAVKTNWKPIVARNLNWLINFFVDKRIGDVVDVVGRVSLWQTDGEQQITLVG